ncbi:hypothetical protein MTO96_026475 [Rhipicephalus appendiculatus]
MSTAKKQRGTASRRTAKRSAEGSAPLVDPSDTSTATPVGRSAVGPGGGSAPGRPRESASQRPAASSSPAESPKRKGGLPAAAAAAGDRRHGIAAEEPPRRLDQTETPESVALATHGSRHRGPATTCGQRRRVVPAVDAAARPLAANRRTLAETSPCPDQRSRKAGCAQATKLSQHSDTASSASRAASDVKRASQSPQTGPSRSPRRSGASVEVGESMASTTTKCSQARKGSKRRTSVPVAPKLHPRRSRGTTIQSSRNVHDSLKDDSRSPRTMVEPSASSRASSVYRTAMDALFRRKPPVNTAAADIAWQASANATHAPPTRNTRNLKDECSAIRRSSLHRPSTDASQKAPVEVQCGDIGRFTNEQLPLSVRNTAVTTIASVTVPPGARLPRVPFMYNRGAPDVSSWPTSRAAYGTGFRPPIGLWVFARQYRIWHRVLTFVCLWEFDRHSRKFWPNRVLRIANVSHRMCLPWVQLRALRRRPGIMACPTLHTRARHSK